jgi:hypothetical protein
MEGFWLVLEMKEESDLRDQALKDQARVGFF